MHSKGISMLVTSFCLLGVSALLGVPAQAAPQSSSTLPRGETPAAPSKAQAAGAVRYEFTQYATPSPDNPKLNQSQLMAADLALDYKTSSTTSRLDFTGGKYLDLNNSYFSVQELYTSARFRGDALTVSAGRKIEFWSQVDNDWQLGLWEPKYNIDALRPVNQGLTGLFVSSRYKDVEVLAYVSPIFVPTINPDISEKDGSLRSDSRWYKTPSDTGSVLNRDTKLAYSISMPELNKLVSNPGAGMRLRYGGHEPGPWASANFARKPINSLFIKYDYNLALQATGSQAEVDVSPTVSYHRLYGADAGWLFERSMLSVSFLTDEPETEKPENDKDALGENTTDWIKQEPGRLKIYAVHSQTQVDVPGFVEPVTLALDYLKADEEETRDIDETGEVRGSLFPYRLNYTNAASFRVGASTRLYGRPLLTSLRYIREFDQQGSLYSLMGQYLPARDWTLTVGVDLLGPDDGSETNTDKRFLNQFRANDRVYGGLSYVF
ncbi:MAG: hypothetical protein KF681_07995 [Bdellovibrionaceae bacterium]|nr:hypothetical protein [Pseudobdellovibrionaceae bacterium]